MSSQNEDPLIGRVIAGKIRIDELLGVGATGSVYRAHHLALAKPVAIKVLHALHAADPNLARRFKAEARAASRLDHPNTVRIYDFGEDGEDRLLYIAMELLAGEELQSLIDRESVVDEARMLSIMTQVCAALSMAHDQGVIHRDMKPGNVMLLREPDEDGREREIVKVCDFGLAKILDVKPEEMTGGPLTKQGMIFGTPAYMSPEQASGNPLDGRTDIYACGVIMYRMVTGRPPFTSETTTGLLMKQIMDTPAPVLEQQPSCDPKVAAVIERAMAKDPDERYPTMKAMLADLRAVLSGRAVSVAPAPRPSSSATVAAGLPAPSALPPPPSSKSPLAVALIGSVALVLAGALGTWVYLASGEGPEARVAVTPMKPPARQVDPPPPPESPPPESPPPESPPPPPVAKVKPPPKVKRVVRRKRKPPPRRPAKRRRAPPPSPVAKEEALPPPPPTEAPPPPVVKAEPPPEPPPPPVVKEEPPPPPPPKGPPKLGGSFTLEARIVDLELRGGISTRKLAAALERSIGDVKRCLRSVAAKHGVAVKGRVASKGRIGSRGRFVRLKASGGIPGAAACVESELKSARLPRADTGDVYVTFAVDYTAGPK